MNESIGTIPVLVVIMIFIVAISGYIAFTVNYSKAFKAKSEITTLIYQNKNVIDEKLQKKVAEHLKTVQYSADEEYVNKNCDGTENGYKAVGNQGWCYKIVTTADNGNECGEHDKKYVKIKTFISIDVPVFKSLFSNISLFVVEGSTKTTACK